MDRFLIKKRKLSEELPDPYNAHGVDVEELPGPSFNLPNVEWWRNPYTSCLMCSEKLSNESMVPSKLKRLLFTKHGFASEKPLDFFKRLASDQNRQASKFIKHSTVSDKVQEASYAVAELIAKKMKSHTTAESTILPACCEIVKILFGEDFEKEVRKIPLSNNTVQRRIEDMSKDVEFHVNEKLKAAELFALQLDESTDVTGKSQVMTFVRFICDNELIEQFLFCKDLPETTRGQDIFNLVNNYFTTANISWKFCLSVCTDGCPSMIGHLTGFLALVKKENPDIIFTHCFIHREALVAKSLMPELNEVLQTVVKMVNFIKSKLLKSRLFNQLCSAMDSEHTQLLFHTEVRWLSRGRVLQRFYELREELLLFFTCEESKYADFLSDDSWCAKTNWDMFDLVKNCHVNSDLTNLILKSLHLLHENIKKYFPSLDVSSLDWVKNPFIDSAYETALFTTDKESELIDIKNDRGLKLQYSKLVEDIARESKLKKIKINLDVSSFWINLLHEYHKISRKAMNAILPFSTSYICEAAFSSMNAIKTKNRSQLKNLEDDMRVCLSTIRPRRNLIMKRKQSQISH
ncbi:zinc finger BED domain-containing protein 5-like [Aphis craccivora]|uniref:Zinc finger BED domain-containing protein 5-like n=1 Tax=Aphis craccivora TaxID=307492 RepID=A0A6G0Y5I7_APHCR|nr:zinc finger BED domain-containing protein 5-like [Aphis craccivora]